jgi:hypothetical protein
MPILAKAFGADWAQDRGDRKTLSCERKATTVLRLLGRCKYSSAQPTLPTGARQGTSAKYTISHAPQIVRAQHQQRSERSSLDLKLIMVCQRRHSRPTCSRL